MSAPAQVIVIALDACDPEVVQEMAAAGEMPTLARLFEESAVVATRNPYALFVGSVWLTFFTARSAPRCKFHCWEEVDPDTYELRATSPLEIRGTPFWETLSVAGRTVAVIDVPHSRTTSPVNGVVISEYGCHDRHFGFHTSPPALAAEIEDRYGLHPVLTIDPYEVKGFAPDDWVWRAGDHRTVDEERSLLADLLDGMGRKTRLSVDLLERGDWDLFLTVFGESHAVGHQLWHQHDPDHPRHVAAAAAEDGSPLAAVYRRLDAAVAEHLAAAGDDASIFVLLSHGMGPHHDGTHLLEEVLRRLDRVYGEGVVGGTAMRLAKRLWSRAPSAVRRLLLAATLPRLRRRVADDPPASVRESSTPQERASQRFFLSPNNSVYGGVRINRAGREPQGCVRPGADESALCDQLIEDLLALVNVETGRPVVRDVVRTADRHIRVPDDSLPDLLIDWSHDAPVETIWSPKTGVVHGRYTHWRTGDHRPDGLLLARAPDIERGVRTDSVDMTDLGASIAARLGVVLGSDTDGRPVPWITGTPAAREGRQAHPA